VLPSGKRAKNARSISLPLLWKYYLVAMATSLDKLAIVNPGIIPSDDPGEALSVDPGYLCMLG